MSAITVTKDGSRWLVKKTNNSGREWARAFPSKADADDAVRSMLAAALDRLDNDPRDIELERLRREVGELKFRHSDHEWLERQREKLVNDIAGLTQVLADVLERVFPQGRPEHAGDVWTRAFRAVDDNRAVLRDEVRPVPAPEPATQRMQLAHLIANYRPGSHEPPWSWADEYLALMHTGPHEDITAGLIADLRSNPMREPVQLHHGERRVWDGHHRIVAAMHLGLREVPVADAKYSDTGRPVTVLRDADPTPAKSQAQNLDSGAANASPDGPADTPSERCEHWYGNIRCDRDGGHTGTHVATTTSGATREWCDPAPSVVPADSPDTGRWEVDKSGSKPLLKFGDETDGWLTLYAVLVAWDHGPKRDAAIDALTELVDAALVRRDRPQPTAEQAELLAAAEALGPYPSKAARLWVQDGNEKAAETVDAWNHAYGRLRRAVDACRTTEGTGE